MNLKFMRSFKPQSRPYSEMPSESGYLTIVILQCKNCNCEWESGCESILFASEIREKQSNKLLFASGSYFDSEKEAIDCTFNFIKKAVSHTKNI